MSKKKDAVEVIDESFKRIEISVSDPRTLIVAVASPEVEVSIRAADALDKFAAMVCSGDNLSV